MAFTRTHFVGYLGFISLGLANAMIGPAIPHLIDEYGMNFSLVGALLFVQGVFYFVAVVSAGVASDFFGKKPFLLAGASFMAAGLASFVLGKSEAALFGSVALIGMGAGTLDGGVNGLFIDISGEKKGIGLGLLHMFFGVGALSGPLLFALTSATFSSWRPAFLFVASIPVLFFILLFPVHLPKVNGEEAIRFSDVAALLRHRIILQFTFLLFVYVGAEQVVASWLPTYLIGTRGVPHAIGSLALSLFFVGLTAGRLLNGFVSEKVGYSPMLLLLSLGSVILFSLLFAIQATGPSMVLFFLLGFFFSGIYPTVMAQAGSVFPQYSGTVSGVLTASGGLGGMLLPLGMGLVSDYAGLRVGLFVSLVATIVMFVVAVVSFQYLKRANILESSG